MTQTNTMPLFYSNPVPVAPKALLGPSVVKLGDFRYAKPTNALPLTGSELPLAARSYPIVFTEGDNPVPLAIVGLRDRENLFVEDDGGWAEGHYIPAYVRRYPFLIITVDGPAGEGGQRAVLGIDNVDSVVGASGVKDLFDGQEASQFTKDAFEFCKAFETHRRATEPFAKALKEAGLLKKRDAELGLPNGSKMALQGFVTVDEQAFNALKDDTFIAWRRKGWVAWVYAHLMSMANWQTVATYAHKRGALPDIIPDSATANNG